MFIKYPIKAVLIKYPTIFCCSWYFPARHFLFEIIAQKYYWWLQAMYFFKAHIIISKIWEKELKNINLSLSPFSFLPLSFSLHKSNLKIYIRNIYFPPKNQTFRISQNSYNSRKFNNHWIIELSLIIHSWQIWHFAISIDIHAAIVKKEQVNLIWQWYSEICATYWYFPFREKMKIKWQFS